MGISRRNLLRFAPALAASGFGITSLRRCLAAVAPNEASIQMENGAAAAGLDFVLRNDAQGRKYQVETLPGGLGVIDFDGDGWPDLFCTNGASLPSLTKTRAPVLESPLPEQPRRHVQRCDGESRAAGRGLLHGRSRRRL